MATRIASILCYIVSALGLIGSAVIYGLHQNAINLAREVDPLSVSMAITLASSSFFMFLMGAVLSGLTMIVEELQTLNRWVRANRP